MFSSNTSQVSGAANYIEDVFSAWLYTGNGSAQGINNGIDLWNKGGMVWIKDRTTANSHAIFDTARGAYNYLSSNTTDAQGNSSTTLSTFSSDGAGAPGFFVRSNVLVGTNGDNYASWTFRKQPKFFDIVTYSGNGTSQNIAHSLGSVPGCIIVKRTDSAGSWAIYHTGLTYPNATPSQNGMNFTTGAGLSVSYWNNTSPTSTQFTIGSSNFVNASGGTYVAYLFAHNAGGFGLTGTDNVISCGSFTVSGATTVTLNYEPQYVMLKRTDQTSDWLMVDSMRGFIMSANDQTLSANTSTAETSTSCIAPSSTGFTIPSGFLPASSTWIYIAIRRGPMKTPTSGTSVLGLNARSGTGANATVTGGAGVTDLAIIKRRNSTSNWIWTPRLAGTGYLSSNLTASETAAGTTILQANPWDVMDGIKVGTTSTLTNASGSTFINYLIDRAPGFMDVVCYPGAGGATSTNTKNHNLGVAPELIFIKNRGYNITNWPVWCAYMDGTFNPINKLYVVLDGASGSNSSNYWSYSGNPQMTSTLFSVGGTYDENNNPSYNYIAYLFASCPGVSKVGRYSGNGSTQTINCGFTGGARFVLIKNTTTGNAESWHVFDTARGMVAGTDPRLRPNTTDSENTGNWVYTATTGFEIVTSDAAVNSTGNNYIFLAIA